MAKRAQYEGKTSVWFYLSTKKALLPLKVPGETWDLFMVRTMVELRKRNRKTVVECKTAFDGDKITTVWLNKTTVGELNKFRRTGENWGRFFERVFAVLSHRELTQNPNDPDPVPAK